MPVSRLLARIRQIPSIALAASLAILLVAGPVASQEFGERQTQVRARLDRFPSAADEQVPEPAMGRRTARSSRHERQRNSLPPTVAQQKSYRRVADQTTPADGCDSSRWSSPSKTASRKRPARHQGVRLRQVSRATQQLAAAVLTESDKIPRAPNRPGASRSHSESTGE